MANKYLLAERIAAILAFAAVVIAGWCTIDLSSRPIYVPVGIMMISMLIRWIISILKKRDGNEKV